MAERRRLPPRRESSVKGRASEVSSTHAPKRNASTSSSRAPTRRHVRCTLPTKIKDGESLPTTPSPQPASLSVKEYQSIAQSAVLLASLERSKRKWLSDGVLERYWTKPKKAKREQVESRNPPKESMIKVGACNIVVGPHIFDAMLYTVKDPSAASSIQYTPPQRPVPGYSHPGNFQSYQPYPDTPQPPWQTPPYPHARLSPQQPSHPGTQPPVAAAHTKHPSHQPSHAPSRSGQQTLSSQSPQTPQPSKPNPDPVIQMLATRAASDPGLKALMRVVASSKATQEQLRTFQAHIDELNAIIKAREQQQRLQGQSLVTGQVPPAPPQVQKPMEQIQSPGQQQAPQKLLQKPQIEVQVQPPIKSPPEDSMMRAGRPLQVKQEPDFVSNDAASIVAPPATTHPSISSPGTVSGPGPTPDASSKWPSPVVRPVAHPPPLHAAGSRPGVLPYQSSSAVQSRPPQYGYPAQYHRSAPSPIPKPSYKAVVFEFTSPLTPYGSSTSGHAGSGDRYLFPEYSILEWLPGGHTLIASFLIVKKVDPNASFPIESGADFNTPRTKGKGTSKPKKEKDKTNAILRPATSERPPLLPADQKSTPADMMSPTETQTTPAPLKEYYQPITFRIFSTNPRVLEPLGRVVKPPDEVCKYMNEIMDRAERAPSGFLAFRLPRESEKPAFLDIDESSSTNPNTRNGTPVPRARATRSKRTVVAEEAEVDGAGEEEVDEERPSSEEHGGDNEELESEEEEVKEFYGSITGLPPLGLFGV